MIVTTDSTTPIEQLNTAIQSHNPFIDRGAAVRISDIWGKGFPDVPSLNAHASDAILQAVERVGSGQGKVTSIAVTAEKGVGKTHLISRIRHRLQAEDNGFFIFAGAGKFIKPELTKYHFLQILGDSLSQMGSQGVKQWQEIATAMLNTATNAQTSSQEMIEKKFPFALAKNKNLLNHLTSAVLKTKFKSDPDIIKAILWTLSEEQELYAIKWLSGYDLTEEKATELGLPNLDQEDRESKAFETVLNILGLISEYKSLIVCFDELDTITNPEIIAELVKSLYDNLHLSNSSRGTVLLTVMMPDTWELKIKTLSGGIPYRVSSATAEPIELQYMNGGSIVELVTLWLKDFYAANNLVSHHPLYPFSETHLKELAKEKPTVRQVLQWCAARFQISTPPSSNNGATQTLPKRDPVEIAFIKELTIVEKDINILMEDKTTLAAALFFGFTKLKGETVEKVKVNKCIQEVEPRRENSGYIDFKIEGEENGKKIKIGVAVLQQSGGGGVLAGLKRLLAYKTFGLTRGCLVRSKEINPTATQAKESLNKLLSPKWKGEWVKLTEKDIKPLLAIRSVHLNREDYELSEQQVFDFINQNKLIVENYLIREILSDPSGQIPGDLEPVEGGIKVASNSSNDVKNNISISHNLLNSDLSWITKIAEVGNSSDGNEFEKLVRKGFIELGFSCSNTNPKANLDPNKLGGAGGVDFYAEYPYPIVGECKATKSEKVPSGTPGQLIQLGKNHLQEKYDPCVKIVVAAGELTNDAQLTAISNQISVIRPETLQNLVQMQTKHRNSIDLMKLKECLLSSYGLADEKIEQYIVKVRQKIEVRSHFVQTVKQLGEIGSEYSTVEIRTHYNAVFAKEQSAKVSDLIAQNLLIELSSPLTGYLGRIKGDDWNSDRFYFLRDLPT